MGRILTDQEYSQYFRHHPKGLQYRSKFIQFANEKKSTREILENKQVSSNMHPPSSSLGINTTNTNTNTHLSSEFFPLSSSAPSYPSPSAIPATYPNPFSSAPSKVQTTTIINNE